MMSKEALLSETGEFQDQNPTKRTGNVVFGLARIARERIQVATSVFYSNAFGFEPSEVQRRVIDTGPLRLSDIYDEINSTPPTEEQVPAETQL